jgi:hypothetical protein
MFSKHLYKYDDAIQLKGLHELKAEVFVFWIGNMNYSL